MTTNLVVVGGGMAGLGAALACVRARPDLRIQLIEQAPLFSEVGAGIQLGPNAVRVLHDWGLADGLAECAAFPEELVVRDAGTGESLGRLALGARARERYGQPYATIHRADLHSLLLDAVQDHPGVSCHLDQRLTGLRTQGDVVRLDTSGDMSLTAPAVLGCDGLWSRTRELVLGDGPPTFSGHLAYRGMVYMADLPQRLQRQAVTAWLGPRLHAVQYPVRGGEWMNVVVVVEAPVPEGAQGWDHEAHAAELRTLLGDTARDLDEVLNAVLQWRLWPLNARHPVRGPQEQVRGRVALMGDAAHPMRPYLAQGAAMALEDAWTLGRLLAAVPAPGAPDWPDLLKRWAAVRWSRNAWVQERSRRNGVLFHAQGPLRWARNFTMAALGESVLDVPRLYAGPPMPSTA
ncbi:FAD-dependent monooxygenase [Hydrogenophaga aquatica]